MATWIAHMRIAEHFMNKYAAFDREDFLVGNIGPDCGVPNKDWSKFTPDKSVSHWMTDGKNIDADDFKKQFVNTNKDGYCFYLGYYFHLLTDIEWGKLYTKKMLEPAYYEGMNANSRFIWAVKKDWYGQDHVFLQNNPECAFFKVFAKITEFDNVYFDFYPKDAFSRQIKYITDFYLKAEENAEREFPYLTKEEMDNFVSETVIALEKVYNELLMHEQG